MGLCLSSGGFPAVFGVCCWIFGVFVAVVLSCCVLVVCLCLCFGVCGLFGFWAG